MRKITYLLLLALTVVSFSSCKDEQTYADQVDRERSVINSFIADKGINVISEQQFREQGETTDTTKNEYVLFESGGLYLQIVRKGAGEPLAQGKSARILCRYTETNLLTDSIQASNVLYPLFYRFVEVMDVTNKSGTFEGSFENDADTRSLMYMYYGSTSIPSGWLAVLPYINLGRYNAPEAEMAKVRIIVPHDLGQTYAMQNVYPCFYEITFQRGR